MLTLSGLKKTPSQTVHVTVVHVRAHDLVDGFGSEEVVVDLSLESGLAFEVIQ